MSQMYRHDVQQASVQQSILQVKCNSLKCDILDTINERLDYLLLVLFETKTAAAKALGWGRSYISNVTTGGEQPSGEFLKRLSNISELVNMDWLFHGRGPMLWPEGYWVNGVAKVLSLGIPAQNEQPRAAAEDAPRYTVGDGEQRLVAMLEYNQQEMQELRREIDFLKVQMAKRERGGK